MEIRYTPTRRDVLAAVSYNLRRPSRFWVLLATVALLPAAVRSGSILLTEHSVRLVNVRLALVVGLLAAAMVPTLVVWRTKLHERWIGLSSTGIQTTIGKLSGEIPWGAIAFIAETDEHVFIVRKNSNMLSVPSRAFRSPEEREQFLAELEEQSGTSRRTG